MVTARVLDTEPTTSLEQHLAAGGGRGLEAARRLGADGSIEELEASGLRGRGGAGFPTGTKWRSVAAATTEVHPATVVVNGAEGEPGCYKDRAILHANPYRVLEGAVIAAEALGADRAVVAVADTSPDEVAALRSAIAEVEAAGWSEEVELDVATGPHHYLFGEETALLEVLDGRQPFPRIAPPYRLGVDEEGTQPGGPAARVMAAEGEATDVPPALVNNVETMANVALVLAEGATWFRSVGTDGTPGTTVVTISGSTSRHGVAELPTGTPLAEAIERIGGGAGRDRSLVAALPGVSAPLIPAARFDTPLCFDAMQAIGSNLGAAGFIIFDDSVDPVAIAHGVARFLAVESCGQCRPCKQDGLGIADHLARLMTAEGGRSDLDLVQRLLSTVTEGARCFLAQQQQEVVSSVLQLFPEVVEAHRDRTLPTPDPVLVAPIVRFEGERAVLDERQAQKQPDWTYGTEWSGQSPADRFEQPVEVR